MKFFRDSYLFFTVITLFFILISSQATASGKTYDVEVVVFSQTSSQYFLSEKWDSQNLEQSPFPSQFIDFDITPKKNSFRRMSSYSAEIKQVIDSIKKSSRYDLITSKRWRQLGLAKNKAIPVRISSDIYFDYPVYLENNIDTELDEYKPKIKQPLKRKMAKQLDGFITIELGRFLHIYSDLTFYSPISRIEEQIPYTLENSDNSEAKTHYTQVFRSELVSVKRFDASSKQNEAKKTIVLQKPYTAQKFNMKSHRKTRSKQLQYIDHPLFGIIVKITPVELSS